MKTKKSSELVRYRLLCHCFFFVFCFHVVKPLIPILALFRGGKRGHTHTSMKSLNPSTSAKPVMTKLQNVLAALVNMDIFQMTLKLCLFTVDF